MSRGMFADGSSSLEGSVRPESDFLIRLPFSSRRTKLPWLQVRLGTSDRSPATQANRCPLTHGEMLQYCRSPRVMTYGCENAAMMLIAETTEWYVNPHILFSF